MLEIKDRISDTDYPQADIWLTRGDTAYIEVPVFEMDGETPYLVTDNDVVTLQVREALVTGIGREPRLIMQGRISVSEGVPLWTITHQDSTIPAKTYTWDAQIILASGDVNTYVGGNFTITGENTL